MSLAFHNSSAIIYNSVMEGARRFVNHLLAVPVSKFLFLPITDSEHKNDPTIYEETKRLGLLDVGLEEAGGDIIDARTGLYLKSGEEFINLSLEPVKKSINSIQDARKFHGDIVMSLTLTAQYLSLHELDATVVGSFTYQRMARLVEKYGFNNASQDLPKRDKRLARINYFASNPRYRRGIDPGEIVFIHQSKDQLIKRFLNTPLDSSVK